MDDPPDTGQEEFGLHLMDARDVDPVQMILEDHAHIRKNLELFDKARDKATLLKDILVALLIHSKTEQDLVYASLEKKEPEVVIDAVEEHHLIDFLIYELTRTGVSDKRFPSRFKLLKDLTESHMKKEELEILPELKDIEKIDGKRLGQTMVNLKLELKERFQDLPSINAAAEVMLDTRKVGSRTVSGADGSASRKRVPGRQPAKSARAKRALKGRKANRTNAIPRRDRRQTTQLQERTNINANNIYSIGEAGLDQSIPESNNPIS